MCMLKVEPTSLRSAGSWSQILEAVAQRCFVNKVFLEISQNSRENTVPRPATLLKKRLLRRCFPVNFVKFLRTHFLKEHLWATASEISSKNIYSDPL